MNKSSSSLRIAAHALGACILMTSAAQAASVTVTGTFTSFVSDMNAGAAFINGIGLTSSGSPGSNGANFASNPVIFSNPTTRLDFTRSPPGTPGVWPMNGFEFIPNAAPSDVVPGQTFTLGTFRYTNGQWMPQADIAFSLTTHSAEANLDGITFSGTMRLISTSVGNDPPFNAYDEADFFYLLGNPALGSGRVFEAGNFDPSLQPSGNPGNTGDFAFTGYIGSLHPNGFVPLNAAAFTTSSIAGGPLDPATITLGGTPPVPEPSSWAMLLAGLGALGLGARRRKQPAAWPSSAAPASEQSGPVGMTGHSSPAAN